MMENLDKSMMRGAKIELTMQRSESLVSTSSTYQRTARKVRIEQRNKKYMMVAIAVGLTIVSLSIYIHAQLIIISSFSSLLPCSQSAALLSAGAGEQ
jgi:cell division septal protein FtsQ